MDKILKPKKIKWTNGMAIASFCLVVLVFVIDNLKEPLLGLKDGYAPHSFELNIFIIGPSMLLSFILSIIVVVRIIKNWKFWPNQKMKLVILGFSLPAIIVYANLLNIIFST